MRTHSAMHACAPLQCADKVTPLLLSDPIKAKGLGTHGRRVTWAGGRGGWRDGLNMELCTNASQCCWAQGMCRADLCAVS